MNQTVKIINQAKKEGRKALLEPEAKTICAEYGIPVNKFSLATNEKEAVAQAEKNRLPHRPKKLFHQTSSTNQTQAE